MIGRYLDLLDAEISDRLTYHNHKETMAWSATGAYAGLILLAYSATPYLDGLLKQISFSALILVAGFATWLFVRMQLQMRWETADVLRALRRTRAKLASISDTQFPGSVDLSLPQVPTNEYLERAEWPVFIQDEICACTTKRQPLSDQLRLIASWKLEKMNARSRSELATYLILLVVTIVALTMPFVITREPPKQIISSVQTVIRDSKKDLKEAERKLIETESLLKLATESLAQRESKLKNMIDELIKAKADYEAISKAQKKSRLGDTNISKTP